MNDTTPIAGLDKQIYERLYGRELTNQEIFEVKQNLMGFFEMLIKLDKKQKSDSFSTERG
ncbi:MAG: hypothetical protein A3A57_01125 [Candidatus Woykebacteria bacterium RIFCSPLOWO2_01_FULL_41_12]|uniref:Uncharacterized protein n=1 Tax=Candidatus Woykebacteria bacterium RIFCSPLOWO2_01_FULL_41_12 TaxID=1802604 RepID=A0A1G1WSX7_9BACT|nr:MAG: hypothetical protein A3A57_01125 [Candidatus Woykebacteria bacterium RIFCSPLOWO2_01_FULL_41_12]